MDDRCIRTGPQKKFRKIPVALRATSGVPCPPSVAEIHVTSKQSPHGEKTISIEIYYVNDVLLYGSIALITLYVLRIDIMVRSGVGGSSIQI